MNKRLIKNPFFIGAIMLTLIGIIALVIYLRKKGGKTAATLQESPNPIAVNTGNNNSAHQTPISTTSPPLSAKPEENILLTHPYQKGSKIKKLQKALKKQSYDLKVDGVYGELTHGAAQEAYPNFLSDGEISAEELILILDMSANYDSSVSWTRPAISRTGESIASILRDVAPDYNYDATQDAQVIQNAFSWFNDDEESISKTLYKLTKSQISQLLIQFQASYNKPLDDFLKGGLLSGLDDKEYDELLSVVRSRA